MFTKFILSLTIAVIVRKIQFTDSILFLQRLRSVFRLEILSSAVF